MEVIQLNSAFQVRSAPPKEKKVNLDLLSRKAVAFRLKTNRLDVEPHAGNFSIKTVFSGFERYTFPESATTVRPGELLFVKEDVMYSSAISSGARTDSFALFFPPSYLNKRRPECARLQRFLDSGMGAVSFPGLRDVYHQMRRIAAALEATDELMAEEEFSTLLELSGIAGGEITDISEKLLISSPRARAEVVRRVMLARDILHDRVEQGIPLAELAQSVFMSEFHLMRCFRRCFGTSVAQYLTRLRMERAYRLLRRRSLSVTDVAHLCGYQDLSAFGRAFRRYWKTSPSDLIRGE